MSVPKRITRTDVASYAQVSKATVSYVINDKGSAKRISPQTIKRVQEAIRALGYLPKQPAQALRSQRSKHLGVICLHTPATTADRLLPIIARRARERGWYAALAASDPSHEQVAELIGGRRCDGFILIGDGLQAVDHPACASATVVQMGDGAAPERSSCRWDHPGDAQSLLDHLQRCGCRRICLLLDRETAPPLAADLMPACTVITTPEQVEPGDGLIALGPTAVASAWQALADGPFPRCPLLAAGLDESDTALQRCGGSAIPWSTLGMAAVDLLIDRLDGGDASDIVIAGEVLAADGTRPWLR